MKLLAFAIYDSKADAYNTPFFMNNHLEAERAFRINVNDPSTTISKAPEDFTLFKVGEYDTETGKITGKETPIALVQAKAVVKK